MELSRVLEEIKVTRDELDQTKHMLQCEQEAREKADQQACDAKERLLEAVQKYYDLERSVSEAKNLKAVANIEESTDDSAASAFGSTPEMTYFNKFEYWPPMVIQCIINEGTFDTQPVTLSEKIALLRKGLSYA